MSTNRLCPQCGTPLAANATFCSNCGQPVSEPSPIPPTQYATPSSPYDSALYSASGQVPIEATQYASPPSSDPYSSSPYGSSSPSSANPYESAPYGNSGSPSTAPPPPLTAGQPSRARKGPNVGLIIGIVVLLLVLIGGGVFFAIGRGTSTNKGTNLAATAQPSTQVLFSDNFANNNKGWQVSHGPASAQTISNNMLTLTDTTANDYVGDSLPTNTVFTDFAVTVTFTIEQGDQGDSVQVGLRTNSDFTREYRVNFFGNQMFSIMKDYLDSSNNSQEQTLQDAKQTTLLNPVGQQNTVTVIMKDTKIVVVVNKAVVGMASDPDLPNGGIGLFAQTSSNSKGITVAFTNVTVTAAPAQLPSQ